MIAQNHLDNFRSLISSGETQIALEQLRYFLSGLRDRSAGSMPSTSYNEVLI